MCNWNTFLSRMFSDEDGQALVEYSLIVALIGIVAIVGLSTMGGEVQGLYGVLEKLASVLRDAVAG